MIRIFYKIFLIDIKRQIKVFCGWKLAKHLLPKLTFQLSFLGEHLNSKGLKMQSEETVSAYLQLWHCQKIELNLLKTNSVHN